MFVPQGLKPVKNLADKWKEQSKKYLISNWRLDENENFRIAKESFERGEVDRAFVYSAAFDALQHDYVGNDAVLAAKVGKYADSIRTLHAALVKGGRPFELTIFSDHGMTPLRGTENIPAALEKTSLKWGMDYACTIDSTMARFWWLGKDAKEKIIPALEGLRGHWLNDEDTKHYGIFREDHKFGDAIFLAEPGIQFVPGDMGVKPLNGMHGYAPEDEDSYACWLSTEPVPENVKRVRDYFGAMT